jgi:hypothetical protein
MIHTGCFCGTIKTVVDPDALPYIEGLYVSCSKCPREVTADLEAAFTQHAFFTDIKPEPETLQLFDLADSDAYQKIVDAIERIETNPPREPEFFNDSATPEIYTLEQQRTVSDRFDQDGNRIWADRHRQRWAWWRAP